MCFDLTVLVLTGIKLALPTKSSERSKLVTLIFGDGLIFFIIAFLANLLATIFMLLNLNAVMSIIANVPAAIASTIVACRAVRRLTNYTSQGAEIFSSTQASTLAFTRSRRSRLVPSVSFGDKKLDGVHVQMETFATDDSPSVRYDSTGKVETGGIVDPETHMSSDFKRPNGDYFSAA
ncbi:hypothetical protein PHLCEN_2v11944 [Hermanssonia centrifuga]|nr:hypothetical protein PHLCEN_2v11944 [Hermanssonia centrifuga]